MDIAEYKNIIVEMRPGLLSVSNRITRNMADAEDVVQEVCLRLWHMRNNIEEYKNVKALCVTMTKNLSIDKVRSRSRRRELGDDVLLNIENENEEMPDKVLEAKDLQCLIRNTVRMLPPLQRQVLHLKDIEGYETEEVVEILGISSEAVRNNLSRARKRLRELIVIYHSKERVGL